MRGYQLSTSKKHHYLPEFYLRRFCRDRNLWIYDAERKELARRFPETIAIKKNFYSTEGKKATEKYQAEMMLSELESTTAPVIDRVDAGGSFSVTDKYYVSLFAALLKSRVPNFERWISDLNDAVGKQWLKTRYASEQELCEHLQELGHDSIEDPDFPSRLFDGIHNEEYSVHTPKNWRIGMMFRIAMAIAEDIFQMEWTILRAPEATSFVTSDNPFVVIPPEDMTPNWPYTIGVAVAGCKKIVPLTQRVCLRIGDYGEAMRYVECDRESVRAINHTLASGYERFLMARDEALLKRLVSSKATRDEATQP